MNKYFDLIIFKLLFREKTTTKGHYTRRGRQ